MPKKNLKKYSGWDQTCCIEEAKFGQTHFDNRSRYPAILCNNRHEHWTAQIPWENCSYQATVD